MTKQKAQTGGVSDLAKQADEVRSILAQAKRERVTIDPITKILAETMTDVADALSGRLFYEYDLRTGAIRLRRRDKEPRRKTPQAALCGARTRKGTPCRCLPEPGRKRCRFHGGCSTGPRTAEGRERIAESNRRRAEIRRGSTLGKGTWDKLEN